MRKLPELRREADPRRRQQKAYAILARNGFPPDVCSTVARRAVAVVASGDDDEAQGEDD